MWMTLLLAIAAFPATSNSAIFGPVPRPISTPNAVKVTASGVGYPPPHMRGAQARLMAQRAAEVVAVRNLSRKLGLPPGSPVGPFRYVATRRLPNGAVEVTVEATLRSR